MKKFISILVVMCLLLSTLAYAETLSFTSKTGKYAKDTLVKSTGIGVDGKVYVTANSGNHSMYYQIRKTSGTACTEAGISKTSSGTVPLNYKTDGYGNSLGRTGYNYRLRVAHRTQCSCSSGAASVTFSWEP